MMEEEGAIIAGLLVGLNVIDANFCMKGEDLDSQVLGVQLKFFVFVFLRTLIGIISCCRGLYSTEVLVCYYM